MKKIELKDVCPEVIEELERLHYESTTKERIIGIALTSTQSNSMGVDSYYQDYLNTYRNYDKAKQSFFENYVSAHVTNPNAIWEINFFNGVLTIYD